MGTAVYQVAAARRAVSTRLPSRPQKPPTLPTLLKLPPLGDRTELLQPYSLKQRRRPRLHYVAPTHNSPSDLCPPRAGNGSFYRPALPRTAPSPRTVGDATRTDTFWPARLETLKTNWRISADFPLPDCPRPVPPRSIRPTTTTTARSTARTTATRTTTPLSAKRPRPRTSSGGGTAGGTWGACYQ